MEMKPITVSIDFSQEAKTLIQTLIDALKTGDVPSDNAQPASRPEQITIEEVVPVQEEPKQDDPPRVDDEAITIADIKGIGLEIAKQGKSDELMAIFHSFGVDRLSKIAEENYPALKVKMEALRDA